MITPLDRYVMRRYLEETKRFLSELEPIPSPLTCKVCQEPLPEDRKLICTSCLDPKGAVARISHLLRGKYVAA